MRTTLTIDDDVARLLKARQHRKQQDFKQTVNEILRLGLQADAEAKDPPFVVRTFDGGGFAPGVAPTKLNQLLDDLEIEDFLEKFGR
ncbi:MAG: hypothetical protein KC635_24940 [Myxococcales bacterium]|nr:hypothetical protein [Myxococcales bacterium]MCB9734339.1 antitoxin [Deltaproteobacteria bacterium]